MGLMPDNGKLHTGPCSGYLTLQQRESSVKQLHLDTLEGSLGGLNVEQVQNDGLVGAEHAASSNLQGRARVGW